MAVMHTHLDEARNVPFLDAPLDRNYEETLLEYTTDAASLDELFTGIEQAVMAEYEELTFAEVDDTEIDAEHDFYDEPVVVGLDGLS